MTGLRRACLASILLCFSMAVLPLHADLLLNQRRDKIELDDGTVVECIIIMETPTGVLVLLPEKTEGQGAGQKIIPRARIKNITKGTDEGRMQGFQTETDTARKVIQGTGFRDTLKAKDNAPATPGGPIGPIAPIVQPAGTGTGIPVPAAYAKPMKLSPSEVVKEYLARYPELKQSGGWLLNDPSRASQWLDKAITSSPEVRARVEDLLNRLNQSQAETLTQGPMVAPGAPSRGGRATPARGGLPVRGVTPPNPAPPQVAPPTDAKPPADAKPPNQ